MGRGTEMSRNLSNIVPRVFVLLVLDKDNEDCNLFQCMFRSFAHAQESTRKLMCPTCLALSRLTWVRFFILTVNSGFPSTRINLSPFTRDFRGGEQLNESLG